MQGRWAEQEIDVEMLQPEVDIEMQDLQGRPATDNGRNTSPTCTTSHDVGAQFERRNLDFWSAAVVVVVVRPGLSNTLSLF